MSEDVLELLHVALPEIFGEGVRKEGSFELLKFCIKEDKSVFSGSQNVPQKCLNV